MKDVVRGYAAVEIGGIAEMSIMPEVPDTILKFPNPQNFFPDNLHRELLEKWLPRSGFLVLNRVSTPQNRKIPCKIP